VYLVRLIAVSLGSVPALLLLIHVFAAKKRRRMTRLLKRLRIAVRSLIKYVSILAVFADVSVDWPDSMQARHNSQHSNWLLVQPANSRDFGGESVVAAFAGGVFDHLSRSTF